MNATLNEIRKIVSEVLSEAKKKKEKADALKYKAEPPAYGYAEAFDFSAPLGAYNLYRTQGAVNWGPMTSAGTKIDDRIVGQRSSLEAALRGAVREAVRMEVQNDRSSWQQLAEAVDPQVPSNVWEAANHWYDHKGFGLGRQNAAGIAEKKEKEAKQSAKKGRKK